jgi:Na+-transporting NADH:ubiquinone oxidoreductase subunit NqrF
MLVKRKSNYSGIEHEMELDVTEEELARWKSGTLIQVACPRLNADEREFLMTGITSEEWNELFPEE